MSGHSYVGHVVRYGGEDEVQVLVVLGVGPHDPDFALRRPGEQLAEVVDQDSDKRQVEASHAGLGFAVPVAGVDVVRGHEVADRVDGAAVHLRTTRWA